MAPPAPHDPSQPPPPPAEILLETLGQPLAVLRADGRVARANAAWRRLAAAPDAAAPAPVLPDYVAACRAASADDLDARRVAEIVARMLHGGRQCVETTVRCRIAGEVRLVHLAVSPLEGGGATLVFAGTGRLEPGSPAAPAAAGHDVGPPARALVEGEAQARAIFEHTADAILVSDNSGHYLDANPAACQLLGRTREAIVGRHMRELVRTDEGVDASFVEFLRIGAMSGTVDVTRPDGTVRRTDIAARAHFVPGRHLSVLRDVTDRRRLEHDLRQALKMEAIGRLAGGVAHDFNNLLTAVLGYAEVLREDVGHLPSAVASVDAIATAATQAATLTRQLLSFSGRQMLRPRAMDLNAVVRDLLPLLCSVLGEDVQLESELDPMLPAVTADGGQLRELIVAVSANARDAMPTGGRLRIETQARAATATEPAAAELRFADSGRGMSPEALEHLFEPFFSTKGLAHGGGLSLASVYGFVHQSGGHIEVESTEGRGTTVIIRFPAAHEHERAHEHDRRPAAAGATILVVEDDDGVRELARRVLVQGGHTVLAAASGSEALELVRATDFDLLLTDVVMPG